MGMVKDGFNKNNTAGAARNGKSRYAGLGGARPTEQIRWAQVAGPLIKEAIGFVTAVGDAITFGRTSDGGALAVTLLSGEGRYKFYAATVAEAEHLLQELIAASGQDIK